MYLTVKYKKGENDTNSVSAPQIIRQQSVWINAIFCCSWIKINIFYPNIYIYIYIHNVMEDGKGDSVHFVAVA